MTARADGYFPGPRSVPPSSRTVISVRDGLDFTAAPALRERLIDVLHRGTGLLILDLSHVTSCDTAGLAVLIGTQRRARSIGITMRLVAPSLPVSMVLDATGLKGNFTIGTGRTRRADPGAGGRCRGTATPPLGLLAAAVGVTIAAVHAMVLDGSGCSRISFSCHSACEF